MSTFTQWFSRDAAGRPRRLVFLLHTLFLVLCLPPYAAAQTVPPLVFVERRIPANGNDAWPAGALAGAGPHSRTRPAAPGRLLVRESNGTIRTLVDGAAASPPLHLVDVNAPSVSWDGTRIVFAGLRAGDWPDAPRRAVGGWRLYVVNADGSGLRQLTFDDIVADYSQFGLGAAPWPYDDYDPAFLPDGRIVFASTRWPAFAHYGDVRASNLWVVDANGARLHRITSERNGADRPQIDPVSGRIVFARWWRNHRLASDATDDVAVDPAQPSLGWLRRLGVSVRTDDNVAAPGRAARNTWQLAGIDPDGAELTLFGGLPDSDADSFAYGGAFAANGAYYANFFPGLDATRAAGFGGIRVYRRGATTWTAHSGVTRRDPSRRLAGTPPDADLYDGPYTTDAEPLADGRVVYARADDTRQDYGLWISAPGGAAQLLYDAAGTAELRPRVLAARTVPPVLPDVYRDDPAHAPTPLFLPPASGAPLARDGRFTFDALNVYANAAVDVDIPHAPPVGSAASIRFYADHQRTAPGTFATLDWPILVGEQLVSVEGRVTAQAPAFLPLFEQLRSAPGAGYVVPRTGAGSRRGAAHVAGMNYDRAGVIAACVGCHAGHTLMPVPDLVDAPWSNLAPGARVAYSTARPGVYGDGVVDRKAFLGPIRRYWTSAPGQTVGQWVELDFAVPIVVRTVRLYAPRPGDEANSSLTVTATRVSLRDETGAELDARTTGGVLMFGTDVGFFDVVARRVRVEILGGTGTFDGQAVVGLAEVEVIAKGAGLRTTPDDALFRDGFAGD